MLVRVEGGVRGAGEGRGGVRGAGEGRGWGKGCC